MTRCCWPLGADTPKLRLPPVRTTVRTGARGTRVAVVACARSIMIDQREGRGYATARLG